MPVLDLATVTVDTFAPAIGQTFEVVFTDGRLPLTLAEARPIGAAMKPEMRAPFALTLHGKPGLRLPQRIYALENVSLGAFEMFLVQVADDAEASKFEAIFN
jgi:hypothetical protein